MREPREPRSIIDAAEKAAAAGDFTSADQLLREAALLQEERLGAFHPDLANTLNNLGIVCEITDNPTDAERYFRRACTIATMVLPADHPFVVTSRKNLQDFCEARGKPAELPTPPDSVAVAEDARAIAKVEPPPEAPARRRSMRPLVIGAIGLAALLIAVLAATRPWGSTDGAPPSPAVAIDPPRESPAPDVERPRVVSAPPRAPIEPIVEPTATASAPVSEPAVSASAITPASTSPAPPTVAKAQLCATLDDWLCKPSDDSVGPGPLFFYTQVRSPADTIVRHQWYRENVLRQSVPLRIQASPTVGYRTFSRLTMQGDGAGNWRVELRTEDGTLLHEERFSVR